MDSEILSKHQRKNTPTLKKQRTKALKIKENGRSADFVTPNFIYGCMGGCRNSYCYVMRYNPDTVFINQNTQQILQKIASHASKLPFPKSPNQTDPKFYTYDIACSTDVALHFKHTDWLEIFDFFKAHPKIKATFATKYINKKLLDYQADRKVRIRFSLMPQSVSDIVEPQTSKILERIKAISDFVEAGYEVHLNFSPIIVYKDWLEDYRELFEFVDKHIPQQYKNEIHAEGIFLTHNKWQHERNLQNEFMESENLLWKPNWQEAKKSIYGSNAIRYKIPYKKRMIEKWSALHQQILPWNTVRYLF